MYKQFAKYYDNIYQWKNYKAESEILRSLIKKYKTSRGREMLDVACGTGNHIVYLKKYFNISGVDIDKDMLRIARKKLPDIKFIRGDMRTFALNRQFDVILCLFSAIGHLKTYENLEKTIRNFSGHLKQGGVMIVEPFLLPEVFINNILDAYVIDEPGLKLTRMNRSKRRGNIAIYDFHFLVGEKGKIRYFVQNIELGMFESGKILTMMKKCRIEGKISKKKDRIQRKIHCR
jgi:ubiquinone/menaquinone biosynthesis C-methylase UbiE